MKLRKTLTCFLAAVIVVFAMLQMPLHSVALAGAYENPAAKPAARADSADNNSTGRPRESKEQRNAKQKERAKSIRAIVSYLGVGKGSVIGDIGAGSGKDTWVFADIVGDTGEVFAEEIAEDKVKSLKDAADTKGLGHVRAVLGSSADPCLPRDYVDLVYMNRVYHHFARPREMLQGIWRSLKPGGYLVVVDRQRGTPQDWVPRHLREEKHFWIAETTVVREAREEGFAFTACLEHFWHEEKGFVLVFQRPEKLKSPGRDPDAFRPISVEKFSSQFRPPDRPYQKPVFIALGGARKLIPLILEESSGEGLEIVLEEWATQKEERPPLPDGISMPSVLTENGDPNLGDELIDAVFFLDSYHLLFHGKTLLARIHEKLSPTGCVYVLDRKAEEPLSRREASHRKMIQPKTVKQEMAEAGFFLRSRVSRPAPDRFLLVFDKVRPG